MQMGSNSDDIQYKKSDWTCKWANRDFSPFVDMDQTPSIG